MILPSGTYIANGAVVVAGVVVTKKYSPYEIYGGCTLYKKTFSR